VKMTLYGLRMILTGLEETYLRVVLQDTNRLNGLVFLIEVCSNVHSMILRDL